MRDDPIAIAELLARMRTNLDRDSSVTQIIIEQYKLSMATSGFQVVSESEWLLSSPDGSVERLAADLRHRSTEGYRICRIIGRNIVSVDFAPSGALILGFETGETLTV